MLCYASYVRNKNKDDYEDPQFVRSGSRRLRRAFSRSSRRDPSPEPRPVKHYGGSSTIDDRNSDDTQV
ncbi:hypothetical protein Pmani_013516 [Petrolisthes manimaculis]|uniref:Uncharacterized protein n=1 Tax=Petrolisthes manimaculis TaxID=1843537 RepID=A0AAE1U999_9EUCA|nr:hypothetical protein Pmani_013516 [Petrolisthes manimaculis]